MGEPHHLEQIRVFKELREDLEASINSPKVAIGSCDRRSRRGLSSPGSLLMFQGARVSSCPLYRFGAQPGI